MPATQSTPPQALFDGLPYLLEQIPRASLAPIQHNDFSISHEFLLAYQGSKATLNAYRRELERLLQWAWFVANRSLATLTRQDLETFMGFCQDPPKTWIGLKKAPRFLNTPQGERLPNPEWRPFVVSVSKTQRKNGVVPKVEDFQLSNTAVREILAILSSFFSYLHQDAYVATNPVALIRQKNKFFTRQQSQRQVRRLNGMQWDTLISTAKQLAQDDADMHERTLFIMSCLYSMYLRISELAASERWEPQMGDFARDSDGLWWFHTLGKGNKSRDIAVSDDMLEALKRWRRHLNMSALPSPGDTFPLLPKVRGKGAITSTTYLREVVQLCFDQAEYRLREQNLPDEADNLRAATVHWLRHTGISEDVKTRPREHVRDDAGHSSSAITDRYIDVESRERHRTARKKSLEME